MLYQRAGLVAAAGASFIIAFLAVVRGMPVIDRWRKSRSPAIEQKSATQVVQQNPNLRSITNLQVPDGPEKYVPASGGGMTEEMSLGTYGWPVKSDYPTNGMSFLACAPVLMSEKNQRDQNIAAGLGAILTWKIASLSAMYGQVPLSFTLRAARQIQLSPYRGLSRDQAIRLADFAGHSHVLWGTLTSSGSEYSVSLHLSDSVNRKDLGDEISFRGTLAELLKWEGTVAQTVAQLMNIKLNGNEGGFLAKPVSSNGEVLVVAGKPWASLQGIPDSASVSRLSIVAPEWPAAKAWLIDDRSSHGKVDDQTLSLASKLQTANPNLPIATFSLFTCFLAKRDQYMNNYERAHAVLKDAPQPIKESLTGIYANQVLFYITGLERNSYAYQRECMRLNPRVPHNYFNFGLPPEPVANYYEECVRKKKIYRPQVSFNAVRAYLAMGQAEKARKILRETVRKVDQSYLMSFSGDLRRLKAYREELIVYEDQLRRERLASVLEDAALCALRMGEPSRAITLLNEAFDAQGNKDHQMDAQLLLDRALCNLELGDKDKALVDFNASVQKSPYVIGRDNLDAHWVESDWTPRMFAHLRQLIERAKARS